MAAQLNEGLSGIKKTIKGGVLTDEDSGYEEARQIWNAMIDRRPAVIVQPASADDVPAAIQFGLKNGLEISIRGAGHNIAGNAVCNGGLMIDFSKMRNVRVDPAKKRAYVEPGATLADLEQGDPAAWAGNAGWHRLYDRYRRFDARRWIRLVLREVRNDHR